MLESAVIDRREGKMAVLVIGDERREVAVERRALPRGAREGTWLQVELDGDRVLSATIDREATAHAEARVAEKVARLRKGRDAG